MPKMPDLSGCHIVLIKDGELLPIQKGSPCLRMGSIARALVDRGHKVTWLATTWSHQFKTEIANQGSYRVEKNYDVHLLDCGSYKKNLSFQRISHHRRFGAKTAQYLAELNTRPNLVVSAYPIPSAASAAARYCRKFKISFALDIRDLWPDVFVDKLSRFGALLAWPLINGQTHDLNYVLDNADLVTAVSEKYLAWAKDHAGSSHTDSDTGPDRFMYFPIGAEAIDLSQTSPKGEFAGLIAALQGKIFFSFLGSFGKSYDLGLIVDAARHFAEAGSDDVHFLVAGDGEQRTLIEDAASRLNNLTYCGWLDADNTRALLALSHVGIMPLQSVAGTFPNKPFQYMAAGLPIISSLTGDFADFVTREKIGINFDQGDMAGFIAALAQLRNTKTQQQMSARVKKIFKTRFEQSVIYSSFADALLELIDRTVQR